MGELWQRITRAAGVAGTPLTATLELTATCNLKCVHCYLEQRHRPELATRDWFAILTQLAQAGTLHLSMTGGEIFSRSDVLDIVEESRRLGFSVSLLSNLTMFDETSARRLAEVGILEIKTSIYADRAHEHDAITGIPGSFERTLAGIRHARQHGLRVTIQTLALKGSVCRLAYMPEFALSLGACFRYSIYVQPGESGSDVPLASAVTLDELREAVPQGPEFAMPLDVEDKSIGDKPVTTPGRTCRAGITSCAIDSHGNLYPCNLWPRSQGNLVEILFEKLWNEGPDFKWMRTVAPQLDLCLGCDKRAVCFHCFAESMAYTGDAGKRFEHRCRSAEISALWV